MPPDHHHPEYALDRDLNGMGQCVNTVKQSQAREEARTERNAQDIQDIFEMVKTNVETAGKFQLSTETRFGKVEKAMVESVAGVKQAMTESVAAIDKKVSNLKWWILGGLGVGSAAAGVIVTILRSGATP